MKELSIKEKAKRYDEAKINGSRLWECGEITRENYEYMFPEIKESKDERIRKELLNAFQEAEDSLYMVLSPQRRKSFIAWIEKQGKNNMGISEATKQVLEDNLNKALEKETPESCNEFLEKQGEQKTADKVEPKFKVKKGEWYVCTDTFVSRGKIIAIKGQTYQSKQEDNTITCEDNCLFIDRHDGKASDYFRLWTIQDAKDGDVLVSESNCGLGTWYCIFKSLDGDESMTVYCYLARDGRFETKKELCFDKDPYNTKPATKEQRDTLMKAMNDAGYKWDAENRQLRKIEPRQDELTEFEKAVKQVLKEAIECGDTHNLKADADMLLRLVQKPWSEEDIELLDNTIKFIEDSVAATPPSLRTYSPTLTGKEIPFLKSLKDRVQPKQEWSEEDKEIIETICEEGDLKPSERVWLKSLKERYTWKPSDEQMEALLYEVNAWDEDSINGQNLKSLYQNLKKLREE